MESSVPVAKRSGLWSGDVAHDDSPSLAASAFWWFSFAYVNATHAWMASIALGPPVERRYGEAPDFTSAGFWFAALVMLAIATWSTNPRAYRTNSRRGGTQVSPGDPLLRGTVALTMTLVCGGTLSLVPLLMNEIHAMFVGAAVTGCVLAPLAGAIAFLTAIDEDRLARRGAQRVCLRER